MSLNLNACASAELTCAYALGALPASELPAIEAHIAACPDCQRELESLRPVIDSLVSWPTDLLRPDPAIQQRLALRISRESGRFPAATPTHRWSEPEWAWV